MGFLGVSAIYLSPPHPVALGSVGHITTYNTVFTHRACSRVIAATPSHRAASAAKGKGSGGLVRWRRENETLDDIMNWFSR